MKEVNERTSVANKRTNGVKERKKERTSGANATKGSEWTSGANERSERKKLIKKIKFQSFLF